MEVQVRGMLIKNLLLVDKSNSDEIIEKLLLEGFEGYDNMNTKKLMTIYIEYYGVKRLEEELRLIFKNPIHSWDNFIHIAYDGERKDLYYNDDVNEWCVHLNDFNGSKELSVALFNFGINISLLEKLSVGSEVLYEGNIYNVEWLDENGDNLYIKNNFVGVSSVSKNDITILG